jgi:hypothetical protein
MKFEIKILLVLLLFISIISGNENRLRSLGNVSYSVPDINAQVNLFQVAENIGWMKANDTSNWVKYSINSLNNWGNLKRRWDAKENQFHCFSFEGLKHLGENQVFYGYVHYNWDVRNEVNFAIEKNPYAYDPFVLADYFPGDIVYNGPEIYGAYSHKINKKFYWGVNLHYYINRGLKNINSEAEIISREISASLDFIYKPGENYVLGLSFKPYQIMDITKLVDLADGQTPITRRYRGEFFYREKISTSDRNAQSEGYNIRPQFFFRIGDLESVTFLNYYYQWLQIFDKPTKHIYDGYFQAQHYSFDTVNRLLLIKNYATYIFFRYKYEKYNDWAKEPRDDLLINQVTQKNYEFVFGISSLISDLPLLGALEISYNLNKPKKDDYLANIYRKGDIFDFTFKTGFEYNVNPGLDIRAGFIFSDYNENKVWDYYKDYKGSNFTIGFGWKINQFELDTYGEVGQTNNKGGEERSRKFLNFITTLKHFL